MRPRSLRAIITAYVLLILAALIGVHAVGYRLTRSAIEREIDLRLATEAAAIIGRAATPAAMAARIALAQADHDTADLYYLLVDARGRRLAGKLTLAPPPGPGYADIGAEARIDGIGHGRVLTRAVAGGRLIVVADNDAADSFDTRLFRFQIAGLLVTALIVIGGAIGIWVTIRRRMRTMRQTVDAVMTGDLRNRVPLDGSRGEFDRQAAAFNQMLDRVQELMASVRHAAKDVTHELKSPLARLRNTLAALERRAQPAQPPAHPPVQPPAHPPVQPPAPPLAAGIADARQQTDDILDLFSSLLRLWEIEGGHRRERFVDLDIRALAAEVADGLRSVAEDDGRVLYDAPGPPIRLRGDLNLLRQLLVNLVENAIRHTPAGTRIAIGMMTAGDRLLLSVADDGPGIAAADHDLVVRRFGRLADAAERGGQGIGLTLVDAIARLHHGTLRLEDAAPGLRVVIDLPIGG